MEKGGFPAALLRTPRFEPAHEGRSMTGTDIAVRQLEEIQVHLVRIHALLARQRFSERDRQRMDAYFDAFASDLVGLEEYLRAVTPEEEPQGAELKSHAGA
jgi:hypothetical protein